ncbi:ATP-dependent sacrificial sulfur transferase LarE [Pelagicoccus mobilis]|uniref:ATP-dependent sacrificial sulfur transferase LarE n=1 Tax=Pelagicoccus mobilis TaxID=415221 RepID=A0A934RXY4_9BACT|nr:ATP-dependent sacrificial sulfur transferase LarE [Pelagicoccus mobilis]MBK1878807.1 ATP-dependent sacrificial sulfur transferase LarE [Pelagicoccus mobilis]
MPEQNKISSQLDRLSGWFTQIPGGLTAFSGGVDSALVIYLARKYLGKDHAIACISDSPSLKRADLEEAKAFCRENDIRLEIINTQELDDEAYNTNPVNRCYACKTHLYQDLSEVLDKLPGFVALNGTNSDDLGDYRPGLQAAQQHQVRSPLSECGIDKASVRQLAHHFGLSNWDKPASPCLSSRIPYGQPVTREKLSQIETAEIHLKELGFKEARVRHFGTEARIEVPQPKLKELQQALPAISPVFSQIGFSKTTVDLEGLVSGKLNRALSESK